MPPAEPLEKREPQQLALPLVDADGQMIVDRVAPRMTDQERAAAMHPQRPDGRLADALAGDDLGGDRLDLAARIGVDGRSGPRRERVTFATSMIHTYA